MSTHGRPGDGDAGEGTSDGTPDSARDAILEFRTLVRRLLEELPEAGEGGEQLGQVLAAHLGVEPYGLAVVSEPVPAHRLVDADIALEEVSGSDVSARTIGVGGGDMRHHMTLGDLLQHSRYGRVPVGQVDLDRMATGPGPEDQRQVITQGLRLFSFEGRPVAVRQQGRNPQFGREEGVLEVLAPEREVAEALMGRIQQLMDERSVIRGQVVTFGSDPYGRGLAGLTFVARPTLSESDVILPEGVLDRVAHHVIGIGLQRDRLRAHGQHLKRGVLLYGPPGTGKTHTVRYLLSASAGTTAVLLSGGALMHIHAAAKVARAHQPAIVVLEDCDLVAEDRSMGMGASPLLFEVLDALDGLDADADVAFVLTTNRVEDLERALAQRPGRVDLAAEIPLPDAAGRLALLALYGRHLFGAEAMAAAAERSEGTTASFAKELVRRAVLSAALAGVEPTDEHLSPALDQLLSDSEQLTRSLLGTGPGDGEAEWDRPAGPGLHGAGRFPGRGRGRGQTGFGWVADDGDVPR